MKKAFLTLWKRLVHPPLDIAGLRPAQGKLNMSLAIDRVSKFTHIEFSDNMGKMNGADLLSAA